MSRIRRYVFALLSVIFILSSQPAQAATYYYTLTGISSGSCGGTPGNVSISNVSITRTAFLPASNSMAYSAFATYGVLGISSSGSFSLVAQGPNAAGTMTSGVGASAGAPPVAITISVSLTANGSASGTSTMTITCYSPSGPPVVSFGGNTDNGNPVKWFNPGDGRVEPRPGDRMAIWCNLDADPANVDIWVVADDTRGARLATFNFKDIVAAGPKGLSKNLGKGGIISISVDDQNNFWVALSGGQFGASGQGIWSKGFNCAFKR